MHKRWNLDNIFILLADNFIMLILKKIMYITMFLVYLFVGTKGYYVKSWSDTQPKIFTFSQIPHSISDNFKQGLWLEKSVILSNAFLPSDCKLTFSFLHGEIEMLKFLYRKECNWHFPEQGIYTTL